MFVKEGASLQVFLQGHPEYDADSSRGNTAAISCVSCAARRTSRHRCRNTTSPRRSPAALAGFVEGAIAAPAAGLAQFPPEALAMTAAPWRADSVRLFRNWLATIARPQGRAERALLGGAVGRLMRPGEGQAK